MQGKQNYKHAASCQHYATSNLYIMPLVTQLCPQ